MKRNLSLVVLQLFIFNLVLFANGSESDKFLIGINRPESDPYYTWIVDVYTKIFNNLDIDVDFKSMPIARASIMLSRGEIDGEPGRIYEYSEIYPNTIRVEEPVFYMTVASFSSINSNLIINSWADIKEKNLSVAYPRGMQMAKINLENTTPLKDIIDVSEVKLGLKLITTGRVDIYVDDLNAILGIINISEPALGDGIKQVGVLDKVPLYMYVHKKNAGMVKELEVEIKKLKDEGVIEKFRKKAFKIE